MIRSRVKIINMTFRNREVAALFHICTRYFSRNMLLKNNITKFLVQKGDLTTLKVDAIVNAANSNMKHGRGLARAIAVTGGPKIQEEWDEIVKNNGEVKTGNWITTSAGKLPCKMIIHAVGPEWKGGDNNESELLNLAIKNSIK